MKFLKRCNNNTQTVHQFNVECCLTLITQMISFTQLQKFLQFYSINQMWSVWVFLLFHWLSPFLFWILFYSLSLSLFVSNVSFSKLDFFLFNNINWTEKRIPSAVRYNDESQNRNGTWKKTLWNFLIWNSINVCAPAIFTFHLIVFTFHVLFSSLIPVA